MAHGWNVGTIGFGTTRYAVVAGRFGRAEVRQGDTLTRAEAEMELEAEMDKCEKELARVITAPVTQGMFDALISFAYNLGIAGSNVQIDRVNRGEYEQCAAAFDLYVKADGMVLPGLINRRNDEEAMFRKDGMSPGGAAPAPTKPGVLDVPYFSQRDFGGSLAWSICGVTSAAMVLSFWGINMNPDAVLKLHGKAAGQSPAGVEGIFEHHGLKADSTQRGTWEQAFAHIEAGRPVVFNGWFTDAGHILVATGFDGVSVICNDPAGHWEQRNGDSYSDNPKNGKAVRYGLAAFKEAVGKDGDVWFAVAWK